ncbi:MAG: type II toxin-antitoxin system RelE/ParE family toxin [Candidatus Symbiothrix sp.]|jgi:plasmid stabilization system protein ParE|nr:type II toxin-antitoxin system RelE/ParE family toxin [Candidatus Symbiothrix sp.]
MYHIELSQQSIDDLEELADTISFTYSSPQTSRRYMKALKEKIRSLANNPEAYPIRFNLSLWQYGVNIRRVNYKKMAIIYTINDNTILIHRVIASSLITEL